MNFLIAWIKLICEAEIILDLFYFFFVFSQIQWICFEHLSVNSDFRIRENLWKLNETRAAFLLDDKVD